MSNHSTLFDFLFGKPVRPWKLKDEVDGVPIEKAVVRFLGSEIGDRLSDLQRFVITCLLGLNGEPPMSIEQIVSRTGISLVGIEKAAELAKRKLRTPSRVLQLEKYVERED